MLPLFTNPLDRALDACPERLLAPLASSQLIITGATGFFGKWILRAIARLQEKGFAIHATCLGRNPDGFLLNHPDIASINGLSWIQLGAKDFALTPIDAGVTHILHMAASSDARIYANDTSAPALSIIEGTLACIQLARKTRAHLHFVSSGAVYGRRTASQGACHEDDSRRHGPDPFDPGQIYGHAKRMAEALIVSALNDYSISRPFAFLGPLLPLDQHFAAGNFIGDAAAGRAIRIQGDGTPLRSYQHPADLAVWLLALMASGPRGAAVNVGGDTPISIAELARTIADIAGTPPPTMALPPGRGDPAAYWPDVSRAQALGLSVSSSLRDAIQDALQWARSQRNVSARESS